MPNFFVIGAMRSGTTSLYRYLGQHPGVYMSPIKEPTFFDESARWEKRVATIEKYQALFNNVSGEKAIGEASTAYLPNRGAAERIRQCVPGAKLIAILRHPIDRAYSHFLHYVRRGEEPILDFARALREGEHSARYLRLGFYHAQLTNYFDLFAREQISVHLYEDLNGDPQALMQRIFRFLGVDDGFVPDVSTRYNAASAHSRGRQPAYPRQTNVLRRMWRTFAPRGRRWRSIARPTRIPTTPPPSPALRRELAQLYQSDILRLQDMLRRDLSNWLE